MTTLENTERFGYLITVILDIQTIIAHLICIKCQMIS